MTIKWNRKNSFGLQQLVVRSGSVDRDVFRRQYAQQITGAIDWNGERRAGRVGHKR